MMNNNDNKDIKFTGDPVAFDGVEGKRDPKTGKGRFDLIPEEVYPVIFDQIDQFKRDVCYDPTLIYHNIAKENWVYAIIQMTIYGYRDERPPIDSNTDCLWFCPPKEIIGCFWKMLQDLAIHFQKGAEHYGERNCQKGIPLWSFKDSAMRHATQVFDGKKDEPHIISAIWNCWMAEWTVLHEKTKEKIGPYTVKVLKARTPEEIDAAKSAASTPELKAMKLQSALKEVREAGYVVIQPTSDLDTNQLINYVLELFTKKRKALKTNMYKYPTWSPEYDVFYQEQKRLKNIINAIYTASDDAAAKTDDTKGDLEDLRSFIDKLKKWAGEQEFPVTAIQYFYTREEVEAIKKEVAERVGNEQLGTWLADRNNLPYIFRMISTIDLFNELVDRIKNINGYTLYMPEYRKLTILLNDAILKHTPNDDNKTEE